MRSAFGRGTHDLTIKVGIFSRGSFRKFVAGLRASGMRVSITEGRDWLDCVWHIDGEPKAVQAVREYCLG